jgi:hypothetical protein
MQDTQLDELARHSDDEYFAKAEPNMDKLVRPLIGDCDFTAVVDLVDGHVIPNGPIRTGVPAVHAKPPRSGRTVIGFVGQAHPLKGFGRLVDATLDLVKDAAVSPRPARGPADPWQPDRRRRPPAPLRSHSAGRRGPQGGAARQVPADQPSRCSPEEIDMVVVPSMWPETYCLTADEAILDERGPYSNGPVICACCR